MNGWDCSAEPWTRTVGAYTLTVDSMEQQWSWKATRDDTEVAFGFCESSSEAVEQADRWAWSEGLTP